MSTEMLTVGSIWFNDTRNNPEIKEAWKNIKELLEISFIPEEGWKQGASYIEWSKCESPGFVDQYVSFVSLDWSYHSDTSEIEEGLIQYLPILKGISISWTWLGEPDRSISINDLKEAADE